MPSRAKWAVTDMAETHALIAFLLGAIAVTALSLIALAPTFVRWLEEADETPERAERIS